MPETPLIVAGTGSRVFRSMLITMAALRHAAEDRKDILLRVGDCPTGGDILLRTTALRFGWLRPEVFQADWRTLGKAAGPERNSRLAAARPEAHRGVALFTTGLRNTGTLDCATKLVRAGVPVVCWCDECGPVPLAGPCVKHSIDEVLATWHVRTEGVPQ